MVGLLVFCTNTVGEAISLPKTSGYRSLREDDILPYNKIQHTDKHQFIVQILIYRCVSTNKMARCKPCRGRRPRRPETREFAIAELVKSFYDGDWSVAINKIKSLHFRVAEDVDPYGVRYFRSFLRSLNSPTNTNLSNRFQKMQIKREMTLDRSFFTPRPRVTSVHS